MDDKKVFVRQLQDYIQGHIYQKITLVQLSHHVYLPPTLVTKESIRAAVFMAVSVCRSN